ncbi:MAG TPA: S8 family serine peptidase, partial [Baekduia sp.]|nr:S8 family serine peptidase [Baekduia sp.]
ASAPLANGAGFAMSIGAPGYCTPAPEDGLALAKAAGAGGIAATPTRPIAVLDTGVDPTAPQLAGRVMQGYDAGTGAPVSGDPDGHGTEAAGLAAGAGPGAWGLSPGSPILPIRIAGADRVVTADALANGIGLAVQHGAGVIYISGTGPLVDPFDAPSWKVLRAIDSAVSFGVLVVAGAGDDNSPSPGGTTAPIAGMPGALPHVLTAAAATVAGERVDSSNSGPWVDVLAPTEGASAPLPLASCLHGYGFSRGTSFAAAALAGGAALVQARRPDLTPQQQYELLRRATDDVAEDGHDALTGFGRLDIATALTASPLPAEPGAEVDDDPFWLRGLFAKAHPPLLTPRKRVARTTGSVSAAKDPSDVYPVRLRKRDKLSVVVTAASPSGELELSILNTTAGDFDVTNGATKTLLKGTGGVSSAPTLAVRVKRAGRYYVAVSTIDAVDPEDPTFAPPTQEPYLLKVSRRPHRKKAPKHHKKGRPHRAAAKHRGR